MAKKFNTAAVCIPEKHYMVNIEERLESIKGLVDEGKYFTINRARQYGKTTTLRALSRYLREEYFVVLMDFQKFSAVEFENENNFSVSFLNSFLRAFKANASAMTEKVRAVADQLSESSFKRNERFTMKNLFEGLSDICLESDRPLVLLIDEVDSASNNQVFLDFLSQLRAYYIDRDEQPTFQSVILAIMAFCWLPPDMERATVMGPCPDLTSYWSMSLWA